MPALYFSLSRPSHCIVTLPDLGRHHPSSTFPQGVWLFSPLLPVPSPRHAFPLPGASPRSLASIHFRAVSHLVRYFFSWASRHSASVIFFLFFTARSPFPHFQHPPSFFFFLLGLAWGVWLYTPDLHFPPSLPLPPTPRDGDGYQPPRGRHTPPHTMLAHCELNYTPAPITVFDQHGHPAPHHLRNNTSQHATQCLICVYPHPHTITLRSPAVYPVSALYRLYPDTFSPPLSRPRNLHLSFPRLFCFVFLPQLLTCLAGSTLFLGKSSLSSFA